MPIIHEHRLLQLEGIVEVERLKGVWKSSVRPGLRHQTAPDIHDYLDIHYALEPFCAALRDVVMAGAYRPREPDVIATEKGRGLMRHLLVPSPADALLLQSLANALEPMILDSRPSKRAFYARSHKGPDIEQFFTRVTYPWWVKWGQFVEHIWEFQRRFPFVVVTDVANYFDNIDVSILRNRIAGFDKVNEAWLDLLLYILDDIKAHGFYGSRNRLALPQIDFDAPRLLATAYLFEADALLRDRTGDSFVRWMDDIDFGATTREAAHTLLGDLDRRLQGLNVRLNAGKTKVLTDREAEQYFLITENVRLNKLKARLEKHRPPTGSRKSGASTRSRTRAHARAVTALEAAARAFLRRIRNPTRRVGHWEKVYKRFLGLLASVGSRLLESRVEYLLTEHPALRVNAVGYLRALGFSRKRWAILHRFLGGRGRVDHAACLDVAQLIVQWRVPGSFAQPRTVSALVRQLAPVADKAAPFVAGLMILAKYSTARKLAAYMRRREAAWRHSPWALRQVAACRPLLRGDDRRWVRDRVVDAGVNDAVRVLLSHERMRGYGALPRPLRLYLQYKEDPRHGWPLSKFVVVMALLHARGELPLAQKRALGARVLREVSDPIYVRRIRAALDALP